MRAARVLTLLAILTASAFAQGPLREPSLNLPVVVESPREFHWAQDSWFTQDKFFDHGSFAFVLAQLTEDAFRPRTAEGRGLAFTVNMVPWFLKEVVDGYGEEGASPKDFIWSAAGAALALIVH